METVTNAVYGGYNPMYGTYYDYRVSLILYILLWIVGLIIAGIPTWLIFRYLILDKFKQAFRGRWF